MIASVPGILTDIRFTNNRFSCLYIFHMWSYLSLFKHTLRFIFLVTRSLRAKFE